MIKSSFVTLIFPASWLTKHSTCLWVISGPAIVHPKWRNSSQISLHWLMHAWSDLLHYTVSSEKQKWHFIQKFTCGSCKHTIATERDWWKGLVSIATITWTICKLNHSNGSKMSTLKTCYGPLWLFKHNAKISYVFSYMKNLLLFVVTDLIAFVWMSWFLFKFINLTFAKKWMYFLFQTPMRKRINPNTMANWHKQRNMGCWKTALYIKRQIL